MDPVEPFWNSIVVNIHKHKSQGLSGQYSDNHCILSPPILGVFWCCTWKPLLVHGCVVMWVLLDVSFESFVLHHLGIAPSVCKTKNLHAAQSLSWYLYSQQCSNGLIRGTQREYSSKPLKHSIVKRILVFKR